MAKGSVHEPNAELLSAQDAIQDAQRLRAWYERHRRANRSVAVRVPLEALLEVIDDLGPDELREVARRAQERLAEVH